MKLSGTRVVALTKLAVAAGLIALVAMVAPVASSATTGRLPSAVRLVRASLSKSTATVHWIAPVSDGASLITRYRAVSHPTGFSCTTQKMSCEMVRLKDKTTYRFTVEAFNSHGTGPSSSLSNAVTVHTGTPVVITSPPPTSPPTTTTTTTTVPSGGGGGGGGGGGSPPPTSYTVTFNANGGTGSMSNESDSSPTALTSNSFTNAGYGFSGWNTLANGMGTPYANGATYPFSASTTLYAQWTALPSFTVTFNSNGGTGSMTAETEDTATPLTSNTFTRSGYNFSGWNTLANGLGTPYANGATFPFTASATLYAQWTAVVLYTVTFNSNGQSGSMSPESESSPTALTSNTFTPTFGYVFSGWNTETNGSGVTYANGATYSFSASITLYAQWLAIEADDNWTGYIDTGGTFSAVSANWVVPTVTCTETSYASQWVGIDGGVVGNDTVEQDGTETDCNGTTPVYDAWYEMYGDLSVNDGYEFELPPSSYPVAPGNAMRGSVSYASGTWTLAIADTTAGWSFSIPIATPSPPPAQSSAEWIMETPEICNTTCNLEPLSDFGSTTFSNASVTSNGTVGTITANPFSACATVNGSDLLMIAGQLNDNGTSFVVTWDASS